MIKQKKGIALGWILIILILMAIGIGIYFWVTKGTPLPEIGGIPKPPALPD